jgi:hypothetical protein
MKTLGILCLLVAGLMVSADGLQAQEETATATATATHSETPTTTATATSTATATATLTPTWTAVIQTVVITAPPLVIMPPPVVITAVPLIVTALPPAAPVATSAPLPTSAPPPTQLTPFYGWTRYQSIHFVAVIGTWGIADDPTASARQYRTSSSAGAIARYPFTGDGVRLAYREHPQGCAFELWLDNVQVAVLNSYSASVAWATAGPFFLDSGYHVLDIRSQAQVSGVCALSFDYVDVFTGPPLPPSAQNALVNAPRDLPAQEVAQIALLSAPATALPSPTPVPASVVTLSVQVAYDSNANGSADLGEGVRAVSVRVVSATTGDLLASGTTDERGTVRLQVLTQEDIVLHVPLLARSLRVRPVRGRRSEQVWAILLPPANQPAVIP